MTVNMPFYFFVDFSEVPVEKVSFVRESPLAPYPALTAALISPAPAPIPRRPDRAGKAQKNNRPGIEPGRLVL